MVSEQYEALKRDLARGWNTWNTRSVLSHVLLPEGLAINLGVREYRNGQNLREALIGRFGDHEEKIHPGAHAYDGSYTDLNLKWSGVELRVQTATDGERWVALVTPVQMQQIPATLFIEGAVLWNRPGSVARQGEALVLASPGRTVQVWCDGEPVVDPYCGSVGPTLTVRLDRQVVVSTWKSTPTEAEALISQQRERHLARLSEYGEHAELYDAMQTCMAWDTVYDPAADRVITPVSRLWNLRHGGWVLFCWDTFFAAMMAGVDHRDLAYSNAIEMLRERTDDVFVPNYAYATGQRSRDRSQPPVGSLAVRELFRRYGDRWFVEETFDDLLAWNRWWDANRQVEPGLLAWGSNPFEPTHGNMWETEGVNGRFGAALESGLDNSPMYDDVPFDPERHLLLLADAGLTGLYVLDCDCLADLAAALGSPGEAELRERAQRYRQGLQRLWDEETGIFRNLRTDTGKFSTRLSPTNFYPLLGRAARPEQARRMIEEHLLNPREFWGEYVLPSISRDDAAYEDNFYWRGRIWAPLNFLVYLGLREYPELGEARKGLVERSAALLLKEWREEGHVHENYNAGTGEGDDVSSSDKFYHWGGLLGLMALMENHR